MKKLRKGKTMKLQGTDVKVSHDFGNGLVVVNIQGAYRIVRRSNLK